MTTAWVVRAGKYGERDAWSVAEGLSGGGWQGVPDLTSCENREDVGRVVAEVFGDESPGLVANYTGQLYALRHRISPGDLMVLPAKDGTIAIGWVTGGYEYLECEEPGRRHVVRVDWKVTDLPRSAVKQDLLYTLGSVLTVFAPSRHNAVARLESLLATRTDPGQLKAGPSGGAAPAIAQTDDAVDDPEAQADIVQVARDRIMTRISEEFVGDGLEQLVQAILEAEGFTCRKSAIGADRGIDIIAGRGVLGMESPKVVVQVKSGGQVSDSVVRDLSGVVHEQDADHGLLVAWGGLTKPARDSVYKQQFRIRAWTADEIVDAAMRVYDRLPDDVQSRLPLQRVWMLVE